VDEVPGSGERRPEDKLRLGRVGVDAPRARPWRLNTIPPPWPLRGLSLP